MKTFSWSEVFKTAGLALPHSFVSARRKENEERQRFVHHLLWRSTAKGAQAAGLQTMQISE